MTGSAEPAAFPQQDRFCRRVNFILQTSPSMGWAREIYRICQLLYVITSVRLFVDSFHQQRLRLFRQPKQRFCLTSWPRCLRMSGTMRPSTWCHIPQEQRSVSFHRMGLRDSLSHVHKKRRTLRHRLEPRISRLPVSTIHLSRLRNDRQEQTLSHVYHRLHYQLLNLATWLLCATVLPMTQQQKGGFTRVHSKLNITYIAYEKYGH